MNKLFTLVKELLGYDSRETGLQFYCKIQDGVGIILWPVPRNGDGT